MVAAVVGTPVGAAGSESGSPDDGRTADFGAHTGALDPDGNFDRPAFDVEYDDLVSSSPVSDVTDRVDAPGRSRVGVDDREASSTALPPSWSSSDHRSTSNDSASVENDSAAPANDSEPPTNDSATARFTPPPTTS